MTIVWIVYEQFIDDPSRIKGIFTNFVDARACYNNWDNTDKQIKELELNKEYENDSLVDLNR